MRIFALVSLLTLAVSISACGQRGNNAAIIRAAEADIKSYPFGLDQAFATAQNAHNWHVGGEQLRQQANMAYSTLTRQVPEAIAREEDR